MIVRAKLVAPPLSARYVPRSNVIRRLEAASDARLICIVAPPGYGKSSLVSRLLADGGGYVGLDPDDDDPHRFWAHVGHALATGFRIDAAPLADRLLAPGAPPLSVVLAEWANALLDTTEPGRVAIDDLHLVTQPEILEGLALLIDRLPPHCSMLVASREQPELPLARWRAAAELAEVNAADLRLDADDARRLLEARLPEPLPEPLMRALVVRTEGWAVGLQLAAAGLSARGADPRKVIDGLGLGRDDIAEYLREQVLDRLAPEERSLVLDLSVLRVLTPRACAALTGRDDAGTVLDSVARRHLPLERVDDREQAYRWHPLLAEHLRAELRSRDPARARACHRRAAELAATDGELELAYAHALQADDGDFATECLTELADALMRASRPQAVLRATARLGRGLAELSDRLLLAVTYAAYLCARAPELRAALTTLHGRRGAGALADADWAQVCNIRSALARARGEIESAVALADEGLALDPPEPQALLLYRAVGHYLLGRVTEVAEGCARCLGLHPPDAPPTFVGITAQSLLAQARIEQGRLGEAEQLCDAADRHLAAHGLQASPMAATVERTRGRIALERGQWSEADALLTRACERASASGLADLHAVACAWRAHWARLTGDEPCRDAMLAAMEPATGRDAWLRRWHAALVALSQRRGTTLPPPELPDEEGALVELIELPPSEALIRARAWRDRFAEDDRRTAELSVLCIAAVALAAMGRAAEADETLADALVLGARTGLVRSFAEADRDAMSGLLARAIGSGRLAAAARAHAAIVRDALEALRHAQAPQRAPPSVLSARELEVLSVLAEGLTNQQVADRLHVSLATVKTHLNHIYDKLGARKRTRAIARARELGLL